MVDKSSQPQVSNREELRAWLDSQRGASGDEPLSGTLALAQLVRELMVRVEELEAQHASVETAKPAKRGKIAD